VAPSPVALVGVGALLSLAGCGGSSVQTVSVTPVAAMQKLAAATDASDGQTYSFAITGPSGISMSGHGAFAAKPNLALQMSFDGTHLMGLNLPAMEERIVDRTVYLKLPGMLPGAGNKWLKISLDRAGSADGINLGSLLDQAAGADPAAQMKALLAVPNIHDVGHEDIDGTSTTHYAGDLTARDLTNSAALDTATRAQLRKVYSMAGNVTSHIEVWVDAQNRARKFVSRSATALGELSTTMTFGHFDEPVSVAVPKPSEVTALTGLTRGRSTGGGAG
jgi:hypothetical protein